MNNNNNNNYNNKILRIKQIIIVSKIIKQM